ncbi:MAG: DUF4412 domain-containing protein [Opitutaceae bacterium]|nr:DUF4412 domain-containing protein [Opitutaceae bacterium]
MKRFLSTVLALASLATLSPAADFEGRLDMTTTAGKRTTPITYFIKSSHLRFEAQTDKNVTSVGLLDGATGTMTILMVEQKMYMQFSAAKVAKLAPDVTFEETGRTEVIAGKTCSEFVVKDKKTTTEIWATSELGGMANLGEAFGRRGQRSAWEDEMLKRGMFALRVITKNKKGAETTRLECTKITEEKLDDTLFTIPDGYTKMPGLGDLFGR